MREASKRSISLEEDDEEFFIAQFKLVVLYESLKGKYQNLAHECVQLRKELTGCKVIVDRAMENPQEKPTFENEKIEEFKRDTLSKVVQAREAAVNERQFIEDKKVVMEEMVERVQIFAAPNSKLNDTSLKPQAGPSWQM